MATIGSKGDYSRTLPDGVFTAIGSSVPPLDDRLVRLEEGVDAIETAVGTDDVSDSSSIQERVAQVITDCATVTSGLTNHLSDSSAAHAANAISFTPVGTIAATDVQAAIAEMLSEASGSGAPTTATYLTATSDGGLSAEVVVGTTPGGELGGTWASPTVDTTHSGTSHAGILATAEAYTDSEITALGLGTAATLNTGTGAGDIPLLDGSALLPSAVIPPAGAVPATVVYANQAARLAGAAAQYTMAFQTDTSAFWFLRTATAANVGDWTAVSATTGVSSVNGLTGAVSLASVYAALSHTHTPTQAGLSNVTNVAQMPLSYLDTDVTGAANSDVKVMSQKATLAKITAALAAAGAGAQADGIVWLDSFPTTGVGGQSGDDARLTNAMTYAAAQTNIPIIKWGRTGGSYTLSVGNRVPYSGMRMCGPGQGEYKRGGSHDHSALMIQLNHTGLWFKALGSVGDTSNCSFENMSFNGSGANYFLGGEDVADGGGVSTHNWQQLKLNNICLNGFAQWLGGPSNGTNTGANRAIRLTISEIFTGQGSLGGATLGKYGMWVAGSDNHFFGGAYNVDIDNANGNGGANSGRYVMYANYLSRTEVGRVYITAQNYSALLVDGSAPTSAIASGNEYGHGLIFSHVEFQGRSEGFLRGGTTAPCDGALIRVKNGGVVFDHCNISWGMASWNGTTPTTSVDTTDRGYVHVTGGRVLLDGCGWAKTLAPNISDLTATTGVPMIWNAGGVVRAVNAALIGPWSFKPQVHTASGTTVVDDTFTVV